VEVVSREREGVGQEGRICCSLLRRGDRCLVSARGVIRVLTVSKGGMLSRVLVVVVEQEQE